MATVAFISHASEDAAIAATITDYLESNGVSCWVAPRDITPGREYSAEIVEAIESSAVFVLVLSENANESIFVKREVERAVSKGKPVFPIRVREVLPSRSLELFISSENWIDAWQPPMEKYLERLAQSIKSAAAVYPAAAPGAAPRAEKVSRATPASRHRRALAVTVAAIALLLIGGGGWYVHRLLDTSGPAPSTAASGQGNGSVASGAPTVEPAAPSAQPTAPTPAPTASREAVAPPSSSKAPEPCPSYLGINPDLPTPFTCTCSGAATRDGVVWGTDIYTDDSRLCRAALHAGVISAEGGPVTVVRSAGRPLYVGSSRNGVTSSDYGSYRASIAFEGTAPPAAAPEP
jgi:hypothetical protein